MVNLQPANANNAISLQLQSGSNTTSTLSSQSFMQSLSDAIAGTLERFGIDPHSVTLDLGSKSRQNNVPSQSSVTSVDAAVSRTKTAATLGSSSASTSVTVAPPAATNARIGFNALIPEDSAQSVPP